MAAFLSSLFFITVAEMGDKTQLVTLAFATRFSARLVLGAILVATLLVHLFSVALGELLGFVLPAYWLGLVAGLAFIGFGLWTLRGDTLDNADARLCPARFGPFLAVATTFFLAELGDKTMLATVTLAGQLQEFVPVWIGSSLGMLVADGLAILVACAVGRRLPQRAIRYAAAAIFVVSGCVRIGQTLIA